MEVEQQDLDLIIVSKEESQNRRLDKILVERFGEKSRSYFQYLIENDCVLLNGKTVKKSTCPKEGDEIEIFFLATPEISLEPENIPLNIIFEDEHIIVINKPANMVVHPAPGHYSSTFVNALLFHCKNLATQNNLRPGIVHRLDKDTTGLLIAAKTSLAHQKLISTFQGRKIIKKYLAICCGVPPEGKISAPIGRHPLKRKEMAIIEDGKEAISAFTVLDSKNNMSLVLGELFTGRTHQLRVHLNHLKTPILGDEVYGNKKLNKQYQINRPLLHAYRLQFMHPITQLPLDLRAPLPQDIKKIITEFNFSSTI